jgi:flagellar hook-basal body complex protein FliE
MLTNKTILTVMEKETGKAEKIFSEIGKKIDEIIENTKENRQEIKQDLKEKFEDLKKSKEKLEEEFKTFTSDKDGKWTEVKIHLEKALDEVKNAIDSVFKKK